MSALFSPIMLTVILHLVLLVLGYQAVPLCFWSACTINLLLFILLLFISSSATVTVRSYICNTGCFIVAHLERTHHHSAWRRHIALANNLGGTSSRFAVWVSGCFSDKAVQSMLFDTPFLAFTSVLYISLRSDIVWFDFFTAKAALFSVWKSRMKFRYNDVNLLVYVRLWSRDTCDVKNYFSFLW